MPRKKAKRITVGELTQKDANLLVQGVGVKTYSFKVVIEPDEDAWHAYCPALKNRGAVSAGMTREAALRNINEVVHMIVNEMIEDGESIPEGPAHEVKVVPVSLSRDARIVVTV